MADEEKGFVIKDRRHFDEKGELKESKGEGEKKTQEAVKPDEKPAGKGPQEEQRRPPPLPEVNFNALIFSLSSSALLHFGEIVDPQTGERKDDLPLAKHAIDTIAMLKEKTKGNLTEEEQKFIDNVLTDLRWRYVKAVKGK